MPATTLMMAEGENGKHKRIKRGPNPLLSTQTIIRCILLRFLSLRNRRVSFNFRSSQNTSKHPILVPSHEYKKPLYNPNTALLAMTNKINGKKGKKASIKGKKTANNGPNLLYSSKILIIFSLNDTNI